ncbi:hypothetical protein BpHYR1_002820 [Brachionus plicatilis]|uniref:Uncharacterized protein n=1 Tax=Brachionus plicatilis TaxID=10195 RepID=A0A3M7R1M8_BRAPC|nr:hypothetical protein BpHYR1_002820 [Brachionus plicatilis]
MSLCVPNSVLIVLPKYVDSLTHSICLDGDRGIQFDVYAHNFRFGPINFESSWLSVVRQIVRLYMHISVLIEKTCLPGVNTAHKTNMNFLDDFLILSHAVINLKLVD